MKKILIVDDDQDILEAVHMVLVSEGYDAQVTTKGEEIYSQVAAYNPQLIILDILLSGNDGRSICQNLKKNKLTNNIPIIMMSAHPGAYHSVKQCGAESFIAKPFTIAELIEKVKKHIG